MGACRRAWIPCRAPDALNTFRFVGLVGHTLFKEDRIMKSWNYLLALAIVASLASVAGAQEPPAGTQPPPAAGTQPPPAEATPPPATTPPPAEATPPAATTQPAPAVAETPAVATPENRIDAVKQSLATSEGALKQYEWSQKIALSMKGEEKARKDYKCSYGADGKVKKAPATAAAEEPKKKKGIRGKIAGNKMEDMEAALKTSMALIDQYSPLEAARLQTAKSTGNVSVSVPGADNRVRITIKNYLKPGDVVELEVDGAKNTLQSVSITSNMEQGDVKGPVAAKVTYAAMADGTLYPATQVLDLKAQELKIDVENSSYTKKPS
jgi:hypothetical protein